MSILNDDQQTVKQAINRMQPGDRLVVSGRAGSGKTYAITHSLADKNALFLTPTHPAQAVLEQELSGRSHKVMTIHKAIGWYQKRDGNLNAVDAHRPAKDAKSRESSLFSEVDIIIVDEFSMVGAFLFGAIEEYAHEFNLPVVYSGDHFQLPPVNDREVIMDQGYKTITLNCSIRFPEDSEIFRVGEMLRALIERSPNKDLPCLAGGGAVQEVTGKTWMDKLTYGYNNGANLLAVTSENKTLRRLRNKVRQTQHDQFRPGDVVMSKQTDEVFRNGEELVISEIAPGTQTLEGVPGCVSQTHDLVVQGYTIKFLEPQKVAFVLDNDRGIKTLSNRIRSLYLQGQLNRADAVRILDWIDQINRFELSALTTVHKSQGRSVDTVYIDTSTVLRKPTWLSPKAHKRLLYTAITRARKLVVFYELSGNCQQAIPDHQMAA